MRIINAPRKANDLYWARLKNLRLLQRFFAGSFVLPRRSEVAFKTAAFCLIYAVLANTFFLFFAQERAEIYWCHDDYRVGQPPCNVSKPDRVDGLGATSLITSSMAFLASILPFNCYNALLGARRQAQVALTLIARRLERAEGQSDRKLRECWALSGFDRQMALSKVTLNYWEAVKEELYTRVFSVIPCEVYCNWVCGHRLIAVGIVFLVIVSVVVPGLFLHSPFYVKLWHKLAAIFSFVAPVHSLILLCPLLLSSRYRTQGFISMGLIMSVKTLALICTKRMALKHERRMVKHYYSSLDDWAGASIKERTLLYVLGFYGHF